MNTRVEPPPKRGMGCLAKSFLTFIVLGLLLVVVGIGGTFWVRNRYISDKPVPIPEASPPSETSAAAPAETSVATPSEPSNRSAAAVRERLDTMKNVAPAHERTGVELTAADINALIASNRKSSGTAFVSIDGNVGQVQVSIPLERRDASFRNAFGLGERYFNASVTIVAPPGTNASNVQLSNVTVNGHSFPAGLLDWGLPGGRSLRSYVIKYASRYGVTDGEIRDGKVILYTSGQ